MCSAGTRGAGVAEAAAVDRSSGKQLHRSTLTRAGVVPELVLTFQRYRDRRCVAPAGAVGGPIQHRVPGGRAARTRVMRQMVSAAQREADDGFVTGAGAIGRAGDDVVRRGHELATGRMIIQFRTFVGHVSGLRHHRLDHPVRQLRARVRCAPCQSNVSRPHFRLVGQTWLLRDDFRTATVRRRCGSRTGREGGRRTEPTGGGEFTGGSVRCAGTLILTSLPGTHREI